MKVKNKLIFIFKIVTIISLIYCFPNYVTNNPVTIIEGIKPEVIATSDETVNNQLVSTSSKRIHIYNTHQGEQYDGYNVIEGANYLKDCLINLGYGCDVEGNDFEGYKSINGIPYNQSYSVSKLYLNKWLESNGNYDLIIDFHRDSIAKNLSTITSDNKNYAKMMFVVGKSSGKFDSCNQIATTLSDLINKRIDGLSRGVYIKKSHYNQGITDNMVLIEFGSQSNTKEEVMASIEILASVIGEYLQ